MPANINTELRDFLLRHGHYRNRFANNTIKEIADTYAAAKPAIDAQLYDVKTYGGRVSRHTLDWRIERLQRILDEVETTLRHATDESIALVRGNLQDLAFTEEDLLSGKFDDLLKGKGIYPVLNRLPAEQLMQLIEQPLAGELFGDRMLWNNAEAVKTARAALAESVVLGEDMARATNRVFGRGKELGGVAGDKIMNRAKLIARSEIQRVSNEVSRRFYEGNQDVVHGLVYQATLDRRTCCLPSTLVYTDEGEKPISEIQIGDAVLTHAGRFKQVKDKTRRFRRKYLRITLSNGRMLKVTPDHEILTNEGWVEAEHLSTSSHIYGL